MSFSLRKTRLLFGMTVLVLSLPLTSCAVAQSEYEAVVAIAKEARRLNAAPGVYLEDGEKAIPKAVKNFVDGKVDYEIEEDDAGSKKTRKRSRKSK